MTEVVQVNRIPETAGQRHERLRIETETKILSPAEVVEHAEAEVVDQAVEQAAREFAPASKLIDEILKNPSVISELEKQGFELDRVENVRIEFLAFRDQVIRSFKELGLDVRKHFGV